MGTRTKDNILLRWQSTCEPIGWLITPLAGQNKPKTFHLACWRLNLSMTSQTHEQQKCGMGTDMKLAHSTNTTVMTMERNRTKMHHHHHSTNAMKRAGHPVNNQTSHYTANGPFMQTKQSQWETWNTNQNSFTGNGKFGKQWSRVVDYYHSMCFALQKLTGLSRFLFDENEAVQSKPSLTTVICNRPLQ